MRFVVNAQIRRQIMERLKAERPEPESELNHNNAFELLIAVMLSAQATDKSVNLATPALFAAMPDAATMAQKTPEDVEPFIKTIGLYRNKAKHAVGIAKALMERASTVRFRRPSKSSCRCRASAKRQPRWF